MNENQISAMEFFIRVWNKETGKEALIKCLKSFMRKIGDGKMWGELDTMGRLTFYTDYITGKV